MKSIKRCQILIKSFDLNTIEYSTKKIKNIVESLGIIRNIAPIRLPTKLKKFTVLRSPFIDKKSREQFEIVTYQRLIVLDNTNLDQINQLLGFLKRHIPTGISIIFKEYHYETFITFK